MHEWSLAEAVLKSSVEEAGKRSLEKLTEVKVVFGELQGIEEELGIIIPDEVAELFCNLGDVVEFVKKQMEVNNNGISA